MADLPDFIPDTGASTETAPPAPKAPLDDFVPDVAPGERKALEKAPDDTLLSGGAKNLATGAIKGAGYAGGWAGDLEHLADLGLAGLSAQFNGKSTSQTLADIEANKTRMRSKGQLPADRLIHSEDISGPILKRTGEYTPESGAGRLVQAGTVGAVGMLSPGGPRAMLGHAVIGAGTGAASEAAAENLGPGAGVAGGMLVPSFAGKLAKMTGSMIGPQTKAAQRTGAARDIANMTDNIPSALAAKTTSDVPGYKPTLADITGQTKHAQAEAVAEKTDPDFRARIVSQRGRNQQALTDLTDSLADPAADPKAVSRAVDTHIENLDQGRQQDLENLQRHHEAETTRLQQRAENTFQDAPQGGDIETLSQRIQQGAYDAGRRMKAGLDRLRATIDPNGTLGVRPVQAKQYAEQLAPQLERQTQKGAAAPYIQTVMNWPEVMPFRHLWEFDQELTGAISQANRGGDATAVHQLRDLKGSVKQSISNAVDNQHAWEASAVQRGEMHPNDTLAARLQQHIGDWYEAGRGGRDVAAGAAADAVGGSRTVSGGPRGGRNGQAGRERPAGDPGVPGAGEAGLEPIDPDTALAHRDYNAQYGDYKGTHRSGPVGEGTKRAAFGDDFQKPAGGLTALASGDAGATNTRAWLAANPDGINDIRALAAQRLREMNKGADTLDPKALQSWKTKYGPALRAIDEASPGFSTSFDPAAGAHENLTTGTADRAATLKTATRDATAAGREDMRQPVARLMGLDSAEDITGHIWQMMNAKDSARQIDNLMSVAGQHGVEENVRRAATDTIMHNLTSGIGASGEPMVSNFKLGNFIRKSPDTITRLYGPDGAATLERVEREMARAQRAQGLKKDSTGSDTARYLEDIYHKISASRHQGAGVEHGADMVAIMEGVHDPVMGAKILGGRVAFSKLRNMLANWRAKGLQNQQDIVHRALLDPSFAQELLSHHLQTQSGQKMSPLQALRRMTIATDTARAADQRREGHARGGVVAGDVAARHARRMVRLVGEVRDRLGRYTEPLLGASDDAVASALAAARHAAAGGML